MRQPSCTITADRKSTVRPGEQYEYHMNNEKNKPVVFGLVLRTINSFFPESGLLFTEFSPVTETRGYKLCTKNISL